MRPSDLSTSAAQIRDALDDLLMAWEETSAHWNDGVSRHFCETHLEPLGPALKQSLDVMGRIAQTVGGMHNDLES
jgi:hypothetical protein